MGTFIRTLYVVLVAVAEIIIAFQLMPVAGVMPTVIVEVILFFFFLMVYAIAFEKWRPWESEILKAMPFWWWPF